VAVRVAVQDHQVLQGGLVDPVVVLGLDPVGVSLPVMVCTMMKAQDPNTAVTRSARTSLLVR
jgi:hypothetical protein